MFDDVQAVEGNAEVDAVLSMISLHPEPRLGLEALTRIICVTNEFLIPVPAKTTVP
jgi:hypothetical protein